MKMNIFIVNIKRNIILFFLLDGTLCNVANRQSKLLEMYYLL